MGRVVWFTGLSGAGKSTLCDLLAARLRALGTVVVVLDGDATRKGLCSDLGFSEQDRTENIRRLTEVARMLALQGIDVLVAAITPLGTMHAQIRHTLPQVLLIFVDASLPLCESRDPKGLYRLARSGLLKNFTGIDSPFEAPTTPAMRCATGERSASECVDDLLSLLAES